MENESATTTCVKLSNLYEACFYLTHGAVIDSVEIVKENKRQLAYLTLSNVLTSCQAEYLNGRAMVNLFDFRRFYQHIQSHISVAKAKAKKEAAS
ncbi:MAG: hypothetical protein MJB14_10370 [Spirochaetes bacterium]|nr:hypothetical protein [Spirochaetota bacterium]